MKIAELRGLGKDDLLAKREGLKAELNKLNCQKVLAQVGKPHQFKLFRKTIARINTLLSALDSKKE